MGMERTCCLEMCKERKLVVDVLSAIYGIGSWIAMTGLWVELPLLVQRLPEGWSLGSSLTLTLQIANVGPVIYCLLNQWHPRVVNEKTGTHAQLLIGTLSTFLLIFVWSSTVFIGGAEISLSLYVLAFGLSIVDCTSSVVFLPYMSKFKSIYLIPYLVGEGISGLLPSLVASAQGIGESTCINVTVVNGSDNFTVLSPAIEEPLFGPEYFFLFLLFMVLLSWIAFALLENLEVCKQEMVSPEDKRVTVENIILLKYRPTDTCDLPKATSTPKVKSRNTNSNSNNLTAVNPPNNIFYYLLFIQGWACVATFGVFPAIQSYSCLSYGDRIFHLAVTLGGVAYPAACLAALFYSTRNVNQITVFTIIGTFLSALIMYTAVQSPQPPLVDSQVGGPLIVVCWVTFIAIFSYVKTMATMCLDSMWGHRGLYWCGVITQIGAAAGALIMFLLVNIFELFADNKMC